MRQSKKMNDIEKRAARHIIVAALKEDLGSGDMTTFFCISPRTKLKGLILAKESSVLCGVDIADQVFKTVDRSLYFRRFKKDGDRVKKNDVVATVSGAAVSILKAERVTLNFLSILSGVATYTSKFVEKLKGTSTQIMDTRKTTPNLRSLEKYAVRVGGGINHRKGLWDGILIKDNHLRGAGVISRKGFDEEVLKKLLKIIKDNVHHEIEIEVETFWEFKKIIKYKPDIILLDNFQLGEIKKAVHYRNKFFPSIKLEASGGVTLKNIRGVAKAGVDFISIGSMTHSPQAIDFSLEFDE